MSLRELSVREIIAAIAAAAGRWADPGFAPRAQTTDAVADRTGYSKPVVAYAFDALFGAITADAIAATIAGELGSLDALDGFVARPGRPDGFARGVERVTIVASDTTIGVAIPPLVFALCAKSAVRVKDRSDALTAAFAVTLGEIEPRIRGSLVVEQWGGTDAAAARTRLADADTVVAFGRDSTLATIRAQLRTDANLVWFGHRASIGYVAAADCAEPAARSRLAGDAARDALLYDGEGCLSLHALFVEHVACDRFVAALTVACDAVSVVYPTGSPHLDPRVAAYRGQARFRAANGRGAVYGDERFTIVVDPPRDAPPPFLPRVLPVYSVAGPRDVLDFIRAHGIALEAFALAEPRNAAGVASYALTSGANRIARFGSLQVPPLGGDHGGAARIAPFVRWIDRDA